MKLSLKEIAELIDGKIFGDENILIENISKIEEAKQGDLTFLYLPAYEKYFLDTKATAILIKPDFIKSRTDITYIEVQNPNTAFFKIIEKYFKPEFNLIGLDSTSFIDSTATIGQNVSLGKNVVVSAGCSIGNNVKIYHNTVLLNDVEIDDDVLIFPNVTIREKCKIGKRVIIHSGTVIGSDGFGYNPDANGVYHKIPQIGNVIIEDDVEIGSNVSVDRASFGSTVIKKGVKIDNLVQVAHNVVIGENTVVVAQSGISGSTKIGKNCILAGQTGIVGHIELADRVIIGAQSGVSKSISKSGQYRGSPVQDYRTALKSEALVRNLPAFIDRIKELEKEVQALKEKAK
ncbi:MAG: UDP-3-O-(3-hydroxymyristoyl)glucosamine N-acyltransferase [Ignavibacteriales bacterium]|nr:UDP-3-O-(3-hydroxymyristoyl)glucosamine N-acyltransferase [Ignavibacteriales bacterium]